MPPKFAPNGSNEDDYITIDGYVDWAVIPAGTINNIIIDMPIRLRVGNDFFGEKHIVKRHGHWLIKNRTTACQMIWKKLSLYPGKFHYTNNNNKVLLHISLTPEALLTLEKIYDKEKKEHFFSIVTIYQQRPKSDNKQSGIYSTKFRNANIKVFLPG